MCAAHYGIIGMSLWAGAGGKCCHECLVHMTPSVHAAALVEPLSMCDARGQHYVPEVAEHDGKCHGMRACSPES